MIKYEVFETSVTKEKLVFLRYHTLHFHIRQCNDPQLNCLEWRFEFISIVWYLARIGQISHHYCDKINFPCRPAPSQRDGGVYLWVLLPGCPSCSTCRPRWAAAWTWGRGWRFATALAGWSSWTARREGRGGCPTRGEETKTRDFNKILDISKCDIWQCL